MTTTMNIALTAKMKEYAQKRAKEGGYSSVSEYIRDLIRAEWQKPRPWLRAEEVTEPGWYWHKAPGLKTHAWLVALHESRGLLVRHGDYFYPIGTCPHVKGCRCSSGLWQRIPEPELPNNQPGGDDGK